MAQETVRREAGEVVGGGERSSWELVGAAFTDLDRGRLGRDVEKVEGARICAQLDRLDRAVADQRRACTQRRRERPDTRRLNLYMQGGGNLPPVTHL
jgi:hypothetical protein